MRKKIETILKSNTFKNSYWSVLEAVIYPIGLVIATPIFLKNLGVESYGLWMLINSILATISILNIGFGDATIKFISKYRAQQNNDAILKVIQVNFTIYNILALAALILGVLISLLIQNYDLFDVSGKFRDLIIYLIPLGCFTLGIKFLEQILLSVFKGFERYDKSAPLSLLSKLAVLIVNIILVLMGKSLVWVFSSMAITSLCMLIIELIFVKQFLPGAKFTPKIDRAVFKDVFEFGVWSWLQSIVVIVASQLDKFIVAQFAGLEVLAFYSLGTMVFNQLHTIFSAAAGWVFPKVSAKNEKNESTLNIFNKSRTIMISGALTALCLFFIAGQYLFPLWLGEDTYLQSKFFINGFIAYESIIVLSIIPYYFLIASGAIKYNTMAEIGAKTLNILCILILFKLMGLQGIIYGLILSTLIYIPLQNRLIQNKVFSSSHLFRINDFLIILPSVGLILIILLETNWKFVLIPIIIVLVKQIYFKSNSKLRSS